MRARRGDDTGKAKWAPMPKPVVAIVGRPNVGKSALFNRLVGGRPAIVEDEPGITRDRIYGQCLWSGHEFTVIDTGGLDRGNTDQLIRRVQRQTSVAIEEAGLLLQVVDGRAGIHPLDQEAAIILRRSGRPVLLVVNKVETPERSLGRFEFMELGLGEPFEISALHGLGIGDLLDRILEMLPPAEEEPESDAIPVAIVGRPNVGKSSLLNALLGKERSLVDSQAGTTRDVVDTELDDPSGRFLLLDTAGLRRKGKVDEKVEYYSNLRAMQAVGRCRVALLVLEGPGGVVAQDKRVAGIVNDAGKASVIVVNKWDLLDGQPGLQSEWKRNYQKTLTRDLEFIKYSPVRFVSALKGRGLGDLLETVARVDREFNRRLDTSLLNRVLSEAFLLRPPPSYKGKVLKLYYATQRGTGPPGVVLKVNSPRLVHFSYRRYLENVLRKAFGFEGTPLRLVFQESGKTKRPGSNRSRSREET